MEEIRQQIYVMVFHIIYININNLVFTINQCENKWTDWPWKSATKRGNQLTLAQPLLLVPHTRRLSNRLTTVFSHVCSKIIDCQTAGSQQPTLCSATFLAQRPLPMMKCTYCKRCFPKNFQAVNRLKILNALKYWTCCYWHFHLTGHHFRWTHATNSDKIILKILRMKSMAEIRNLFQVTLEPKNTHRIFQRN